VPQIEIIMLLLLGHLSHEWKIVVAQSAWDITNFHESAVMMLNG
jgi:hypothetical protein